MNNQLTFFVDLERQVWEALRTGDPTLDRALLSEEFLGVYSTGFAGRADHASALDAGPTVASYTLSMPRLMQLSPDLVLLAYHAAYMRTGGVQPEEMYVSSIWRRDADGWINIFSQDSALSDHAPV